MAEVQRYRARAAEVEAIDMGPRGFLLLTDPPRYVAADVFLQFFETPRRNGGGAATVGQARPPEARGVGHRAERRAAEGDRAGGAPGAEAPRPSAWAEERRCRGGRPAGAEWQRRVQAPRGAGDRSARYLEPCVARERRQRAGRRLDDLRSVAMRSRVDGTLLRGVCQFLMASAGSRLLTKHGQRGAKAHKSISHRERRKRRRRS